MRYEPVTMRRLRPSRALFVPIALGTIAATAVLAPHARAASGPGGVDMLPILEALVLVLIGAKLGGALFERMRQSAVLGELLVGVVLGNLGLVGYHALEALRT